MIRRALRTREVGHAGTLDPMASGVLVVAIGEATKLVPYLTRAAKEYVARVELGKQTDTLDALGAVVEEQPVDDELLGELDGTCPTARIDQAVAHERARTSQVPPAFSAIQQGGERAYARARRGEAVALPAREVRVHRLVVTASGTTPAPWLELRVKADKGYYVRALGRDLARELGTVGTVSALRRTDSGGFADTEAVAVPATREALLKHLIPLSDAARRALPSASLTDTGVVEARFGRRVLPAGFEEMGPRGEPAAWFDGAGDLVAVGLQEEEDARVVRGFGTPSASPPCG